MKQRNSCGFWGTNSPTLPGFEASFSWWPMSRNPQLRPPVDSKTLAPTGLRSFVVHEDPRMVAVPQFLSPEEWRPQGHWGVELSNASYPSMKYGRIKGWWWLRISWGVVAWHLGGVSLDSYNDGFLMMEMIGFVLAFSISPSFPAGWLKPALLAPHLL